MSADKYPSIFSRQMMGGYCLYSLKGYFNIVKAPFKALDELDLRKVSGRLFHNLGGHTLYKCPVTIGFAKDLGG